MSGNINQADAERVLKIIESLVEHVPEDIRLELDSLVGLLKSPLFYQYLDHQDLQKISQLSNKGEDIKELCKTVQKLKLSVEIESCSNISTVDECNRTDHLTTGGDDVAGGSYSEADNSDTLKQDDTLTPQEDPHAVKPPCNKKISIKRERIALCRIGGESLGFDVCGTVHNDEPGPVRVFIQKIKPGSLADRDGRLQSGDEIIAINDNNVADIEGGPEAMLQVLEKSCQHDRVEFMIKRKLVSPPPVEVAPATTLSLESPPNTLSLERRKLILTVEGELLVPIKCKLQHPGTATGLGFGIVDDVYGNVRISTIIRDGIADKSGALDLRDVILEINGAMVRGLSQQHIATLLQVASPNIDLLVGRASTDLDLLELATNLEGVIWEPLTLCDKTGGVKVLEVRNNSVITTNHVIVQVNGVPLEVLSSNEAEEVLRNAIHVSFVRENHVTQHVAQPVTPDTPDSEKEVQRFLTPDLQQQQQQEIAYDPAAQPDIWETTIRYVEFEKRSSTLGITISPLIDPLAPSRSVIVIESVQEDTGIQDKITPGSLLNSINDKIFNNCSFDIVTRVLKLTPEGPVKLGIRSLVQQPRSLEDSQGRAIAQRIVTVRNNADFPGITLKPSSHAFIPGFTVCSILPGGLFEVDGRVKPGDIIVSLNYTDTSCMTLRNIRSMIEGACKSTSLLRVAYVENSEAIQEYTVSVHRHAKTGIGICIVGGALRDKPDNGIYIKKIVDPTSPLKRGEQIIKVNEIPMQGKTHEEAVEILKTASSPLLLTLQTPPVDVFVKNSNPEQDLTETLVFGLPKTRDQSLGLVLGTCEVGILVSHVEENSIGDLLGVTSGDIIVKVNDTALRGVPQDMMMPILRQQDGPTNITVVRKPPRKSQVATPVNSVPGTPNMIDKHPVRLEPELKQQSSEEDVTKTANSFVVNIRKEGTTSLGINVVQRGSGIYIKNIVPDFPASQCDNLFPGDQILAVNKHALTGISRNKAIAVLRKVEGNVQLVCVRPNFTIATINSSSDKENQPNSRSSSPFIELEALEPLHSGAPPWKRATGDSDQAEVSALKRVNNLTPDNISLNSHASGENRRSNGEDRHDRVSEMSHPSTKQFQESPSGSINVDHTPTGSIRSHTPTGSIHQTPTGSVRRSPDSARHEDRSSLADRRISWNDTPIEVDSIKARVHNNDSGSGVQLIPQHHTLGFLVKEVTPNTPAHQIVWSQDIITRINDQVALEMSFSEAAGLLAEKGLTVALEIKRDSPCYMLHSVTLQKPKSGSLGLSITERRSLPGIYISQVTPGGVAEAHGGIEKGQRIMSINGESVKYMRQSQFIGILKGCGDRVELVVGSMISDNSDNRSTTPSSSKRDGSLRGSRSSLNSSRSQPFRGLARPSPPQSPLVPRSPHASPRSSTRSSGSPIYTQVVRDKHARDMDRSCSPQGSYRDADTSHHSSQRDIGPGSRHGSQRSDIGMPHYGSFREGSQLSQHSDHSSHRDQYGSYQGSQRDINSHHGGSFRDQFARDFELSQQGLHRNLGSQQGSQRDLGLGSQHGSQRDLGSQHGSQRDLGSQHGSQRDLGSQHGSQRDFGSQQGSQREFGSQHGSQRDLGSQHGSQRDLGSQQGSQRLPAYQDCVRSHRSSHNSQRSSRNSSRHPSPPRSQRSLQSSHSKRSNTSDRGMRSGSLQCSVQSVPSDYNNSLHSMATQSAHSMDSRSTDARSLDNTSNLSTGSYVKNKAPLLRTANLYREKSAPLGLSLGGGRGWPLGSIPLYITSLQKGGIADRTNVLKENDRIVSINGTNVEDYSHEDAVNLLREATSPVTLVVMDPDTHRPDFRVVKLNRSAESFGFSIVGGSDNVPPLPITVKAVYHTGPAHGKLKRGDQIISVNGKSIEDYTREEATLLLKSCTETVRLVIQ